MDIPVDDILELVEINKEKDTSQGCLILNLCKLIYVYGFTCK